MNNNTQEFVNLKVNEYESKIAEISDLYEMRKLKEKID